jgi:hypothetical protein
VELLRVSAPEPTTTRGEAIRILVDGLLELIIQRGRQRTSLSPHLIVKVMGREIHTATCRSRFRAGVN